MTSKFVEMIKAEHEKAVRKHPFFANCFTLGEPEDNTKMLNMLRMGIAQLAIAKCLGAESILQCEVLEAIEAYHNGNLDYCHLHHSRSAVPSFCE